MTLLELTQSEIKAILDPPLNGIPKPYDILMEAIESISLKKLESRYVKTYFSEVMELVANDTFSKFQSYEKNTLKPITQSFIKKYESAITSVIGKSLTKETLNDFLEGFIPLALQLEKRMGNKRKARAGVTFEYITEILLKKADIQCERTSTTIRKKLNRMDIVIPNQAMAFKTPDKAKFLSCKHTLRERWKQALPEKNRNWVMYLITLDDSIPEDKAKEIKSHDLILYVKDQVKQELHLKKKDWIRSLSDLPNDLNH